MWLLIPIIFYTLIYLYIRHVYTYWKRKGFPSERSSLSWRFLKQVYKREFQHIEALNDAYRMGKENDFMGIYFFFRPTLLIRNLTLAKTILENNNGNFYETKWNYVQGFRKINLLEKLSPIFAVNRIEGMFRNIERVADYMMNHMKAITLEKKTTGVDIQHILRVYSINIIGNLIYGLNSNNFEEADSIFASYLKGSGNKCSLTSFTLNHLPKKSSLTYRLRDIIKDSVENREEHGHIRKDILQLLVKFRNGNDIANNAKANWHIENYFGNEKILSIKKLSKIAEDFLTMGLERITSTTVLTLFEVLQEPLLLQKVMEEIYEMKSSSSVDKQMSYVTIEKMKYLDICIKETQRKYPGVPFIERVCRKNFNIPDSRYIINEGNTVIIPLMALQRDEKYFKEPLTYKPERFLQDDTQNEEVSVESTQINYNLGAEACLAQNFYNIVVKIAIVKLLQNFNMELVQGKNMEHAHSSTTIIKSVQGFKVKLKTQEIKSNFYI